MGTASAAACGPLSGGVFYGYGCFTAQTLERRSTPAAARELAASTQDSRSPLFARERGPKVALLLLCLPPPDLQLHQLAQWTVGLQLTWSEQAWTRIVVEAVYLKEKKR